MKPSYKMTLSNGFILSRDGDGHYYYFKPGVLCNRISKDGVHHMTEPMRTEVYNAMIHLDNDEAANELDRKSTIDILTNQNAALRCMIAEGRQPLTSRLLIAENDALIERLS